MSLTFFTYRSTTGVGQDHVLQHKLLGTTETAHITLHSDGKVNLSVKRTATFLAAAIKSNLAGFTPIFVAADQVIPPQVRDHIDMKHGY